MWLFCHLHDDAIQGNPSDSAVFENPRCQIGRAHFIYFCQLESKGGRQLLPIMKMVLNHMISHAGAKLLFHMCHWHVQICTPLY